LCYGAMTTTMCQAVNYFEGGDHWELIRKCINMLCKEQVGYSD